jgi:hypothetical protein
MMTIELFYPLLVMTIIDTCESHHIFFPSYLLVNFQIFCKYVRCSTQVCYDFNSFIIVRKFVSMCVVEPKHFFMVVEWFLISFHNVPLNSQMHHLDG